MRKVGE
jgi:hypothetical protein